MIPIIGLLSSFAFIYIHSPSVFNLHQVLSNVSPILVLIISIVIVEEVNEKQLKNLIIVLIAFSIWNLSYFKQIPKEFGIRKTSITFSFKFQKEVNRYIENSITDLKAVSFRSIFENEFRVGDNSSWKYDFQNKFQDLYYSQKISLPLELGVLLDISQRNFDFSHPYFKRFKDRIVTNERIALFLLEKNVDVLFIEKSINLSPIIISNYRLLFSDQLTGDTFWIRKLKN